MFHSTLFLPDEGPERRTKGKNLYLAMHCQISLWSRMNRIYCASSGPGWVNGNMFVFRGVQEFLRCSFQETGDVHRVDNNPPTMVATSFRLKIRS